MMICLLTVQCKEWANYSSINANGRKTGQERTVSNKVPAGKDKIECSGDNTKLQANEDLHVFLHFPEVRGFMLIISITIVDMSVVAQQALRGECAV